MNKEHINALLACKVESRCQSLRVANAALSQKLAAKAELRRAGIEVYRQNAGLPECPPVCPGSPGD